MRALACVVVASAIACGGQHAPQPAPLPPLPGTPDGGVLALGIDAAAPPAVLTFAPTPWGHGDRMRIEVDTDDDKGAQKDVDSLLVEEPEPAKLVVMIDRRVPDAEHAAGTSCVASMTAEGPAADGPGLACAIAKSRLAALVDLGGVARAEKSAGDHADGLGRLPLDLIGATPGKTTAVLESFGDHGHAVLTVTADGTRDGRAIHLRGRINVDHTLTAAVGHLEGTDGDHALAVHFDLGPAD